MVKYLFRRRDDLVAPPEIPFDMVIEILRRLPAKSLMRFRCVSKLWFCLIRSRYFSNLYLMVSSSLLRAQPRGLYKSLSVGSNWSLHYTCDSMENCHKPGKFDLLSLRLSSSSSIAESSSLEPDLTFPGGMGGHRMVSLRGLFLFTVCRKASIYNPATRQSLPLLAIKSNIFAQQEPYKHVYYFFGHDPVLDQYKIVSTVMIASSSVEMLFSEFWVFLLEPGGFWKRIEYDAQPHLPTGQGLCINGFIYYPAFNHTCRHHLYCFDVKSEDIRVIQAPHAMPQFRPSFGFIEHGGKPAIFDHTRISQTGVSELWVLEDGLVGTWSRKSLVLKPCQKHSVDDINSRQVRVHGTGQNNEVILALLCPCYLLYYDLIKNDLRKVCITKETTPSVSFSVLDKCESIMHLET